MLAGGGIFWKATERLRLGGALAFFHSETYNDGNAFIAPLPLLAYEWRAVTANLVYFPKVSGINEINTLGFWLTFWPKASEFGVRPVRVRETNCDLTPNSSRAESVLRRTAPRRSTPAAPAPPAARGSRSSSR